MMNELTDDQIVKIAEREMGLIHAGTVGDSNLEDFARAIIAADRALRQAGQEPAGYFYEGREPGDWVQAHDPMFLSSHTPLYTAPKP
jgi:hypothetical protein